MSEWTFCMNNSPHTKWDDKSAHLKRETPVKISIHLMEEFLHFSPGIAQYYISLLSGMWNIEDQYRNPNIDNGDHLVGQLSTSALGWPLLQNELSLWGWGWYNGDVGEDPDKNSPNLDYGWSRRLKFMEVPFLADLRNHPHHRIFTLKFCIQKNWEHDAILLWWAFHSRPCLLVWTSVAPKGGDDDDDFYDNFIVMMMMMMMTWWW